MALTAAQLSSIRDLVSKQLPGVLSLCNGTHDEDTKIALRKIEEALRQINSAILFAANQVASSIP